MKYGETFSFLNIGVIVTFLVLGSNVVRLKLRNNIKRAREADRFFLINLIINTIALFPTRK